MNIPVITVDGPTASGKGTVAQRVADALQFHYLDSGSLYRLVALQSLEQGVGAGGGRRTGAAGRDASTRVSSAGASCSTGAT